MYKINKEIW